MSESFAQVMRDAEVVLAEAQRNMEQAIELVRNSAAVIALLTAENERLTEELKKLRGQKEARA